MSLRCSESVRLKQKTYASNNPIYRLSDTEHEGAVVPLLHYNARRKWLFCVRWSNPLGCPLTAWLSQMSRSPPPRAPPHYLLSSQQDFNHLGSLLALIGRTASCFLNSCTEMTRAWNPPILPPPGPPSCPTLAALGYCTPCSHFPHMLQIDIGTQKSALYILYRIAKR